MNCLRLNPQTYLLDFTNQKSIDKNLFSFFIIVLDSIFNLFAIESDSI